jgi:hypothetical protein
MKTWTSLYSLEGGEFVRGRNGSHSAGQTLASPPLPQKTLQNMKHTESENGLVICIATMSEADKEPIVPSVVIVPVTSHPFWYEG